MLGYNVWLVALCAFQHIWQRSFMGGMTFSPIRNTTYFNKTKEPRVSSSKVSLHWFAFISDCPLASAVDKNTQATFWQL